MPYRDKDKLKQYQKNYFKKNQGLLSLKRKRRTSETPVAQSQPDICSIPAQSLPLSNKPLINELRQKMADMQKPKVIEVLLEDDFVEDVVIEPVYE